MCLKFMYEIELMLFKTIKWITVHGDYIIFIAKRFLGVWEFEKPIGITIMFLFPQKHIL